MPLWSVLCALFATACLLGNGRMAWAALILLADWCCCTALYLLTGNQFMWEALAAVDYTAALLLIIVMPCRWSAVLAASYVVEGMAHVAYGFSERGPLQQYSYWQVLHYIAWGQAWALIAWGVWSGGRRARRHLHHCRRTHPAAMGASHRDDGRDAGR